MDQEVLKKSINNLSKSSQDPMIKGGTQAFQFGDFVLDAANGELLRDGERVQVPPKVLEMLILLVESRGAVVSKAEMMTMLWPDTFVEESNLTQNIFTLRKILGEADGTKFIETVPRRGYKFAVDVRPVPVQGATVLLQHDTHTRVVVEPAGTRISAGALVAVGFVLLGTSALVVGAVFAWARFNPTGREPAGSASIPLSIKRLTYQSSVYHAGISPEGKYLAYNLMTDTDDGPQQSLQLQNISTGSVVQIMPPATPGYSSITFSPDGNYLYFGTGRKGVTNGIIARVPVLGGTGQEIATNVWSAFALSPDGQQLVFTRSYSSTDEPQALILVNVTDGKERKLVVNDWQGQKWFNYWGSAPAWSPDGKSIAITGGVKDERGMRGALFEVRVSDGGVTEMITPRWAGISQVAWLAEGKAVIVSAQQKDGEPFQLWQIAYPSGETIRLTNDLSNYDRITVTLGTNQIAAQQTTRVSHIWLLRAGETSGGRQLTVGSASDGHSGIDFSPGGQIVFASNRSGESDLWTMDADGNGPRQLTAKTGGRNTRPVHTPDGRYLVFDSYRTGVSQIWRTDINGNNPVQLTNSVATAPAVSPDSRWVYYTNWAQSPTVIEKISIDGGEPVRITNGKYSAGFPSVSPDGKLLAHTYYDDEKGWRVAVIPAEGGDPMKLFNHAADHIFRWTRDSRALVFIKPVVGNMPGSNLWRQPIDGGAPVQLTKFGQKEDAITNFAISADGERIAIARGRLYSDVVLLSNVR